MRQCYKGKGIDPCGQKLTELTRLIDMCMIIWQCIGVIIVHSESSPPESLFYILKYLSLKGSRQI